MSLCSVSNNYTSGEQTFRVRVHLEPWKKTRVSVKFIDVRNVLESNVFCRKIQQWGLLPEEAFCPTLPYSGYIRYSAAQMITVC